MKESFVKITITDFVAQVLFFNPKGNALHRVLLEKLIDTFEELSNNKRVKVIVLKSCEEKIFCAGASLEELLSIETLRQGITFFEGFANLINAMRTCSKIIIGDIQGKSVGGGVGLIAACDYALATENSAIKLSELSIGIGPFVIAPAVIRKIGKSAFTELTLQPNCFQTALWARQKGLYMQIFSDKNSLEMALKALVIPFKKYNLQALQHLKRILWEGYENWDILLSERAKITANLTLSKQTKKLINAFKKK